MVVTVIDPIILNTVRATVDRSPVLLPRAGRGRAAGRLPLKDLADRESVLVHRVCGYVLHLGRLVKVDVAVGVVQVLLARVRHQRGRFPWIPARGWRTGVVAWRPATVMADGGDNDNLVTSGTLIGVLCNLSTVG